MMEKSSGFSVLEFRNHGFWFHLYLSPFLYQTSFWLLNIMCSFPPLPCPEVLMIESSVLS